MAPKCPVPTNNTERRAGRRPSKEWDEELSAELSGDFQFGSYDNVILKQEIKEKLKFFWSWDPCRE